MSTIESTVNEDGTITIRKSWGLLTVARKISKDAPAEAVVYAQRMLEESIRRLQEGRS